MMVSCSIVKMYNSSLVLVLMVVVLLLVLTAVLMWGAVCCWTNRLLSQTGCC